MKTFLSVLAVCCALLASTTQAQNKTVIKNVTVISMDPTRPQAETGMDVFIDGNAIQKIAPASKALTDDYDIVDGTGKYLIPGLADMHAHLPRASSPFSSKDYLLLNLLHGVTTLRQMRGTAQDLVLRDSVKSGLLLGPNTYITAPPGFWTDSTYTNKYFTAQMVRDSLTKFKAQGYDLVKYLGGLTLEQFDTLVMVAASVGFKVGGHAPKNDLVKAVELDMYSIEHIPPFADLYMKDSVLFWQTIERMVEKGLVCCPDIRFYVLHGMHTRAQLQRSFSGIEFLPKDVLDTLEKEFTDYTTSFYREDPSAFARAITRDSVRIEVFKRIMAGMYERGVKLLISPGAGDFFVPGASYADELELFVESKLTAYQALQCATCNAAESLGELAKWGTVTAGKKADMILLEADPLQDIGNVRKIDATIIGGVVLKPSELRSRLKS